MHNIVVGIDEVGRGPWAGPVVSAAVALNLGQTISGVNDSKLLSRSRRESLISAIKQSSTSIGLGWVSSTELDAIGLSEAVALSMKIAISHIKCKYNDVIIDGSIDYLKLACSRAIPRADQLFASVSAASIVAKVSRDNYMVQLAKIHPGYGFEKHVGYGTKMHADSLRELGISTQHRLSFSPIAALGEVKYDK